MATTTKQTTFDFDKYNAIMRSANSGLKLHLAEQMLLDVQQVMVRFKSPLRHDIASIVDNLAQLRADNKKYLASQQRKVDEYKAVVVEDNRGTDDTKLTSYPHTTSVDGGRLSDTSGPQATVDRIERTLGSAPL